MTKAATYQCPNCNGVLAFDAQTGMLACSFCGGTFSEGEVERAIPLDSKIAAEKTEHVTSVEEFLEHAPWEATGANAANSIGYSCPACGAGVIADQSAVTAKCPYCGNNMLVSGIASAANIPQKVLPFSFTREEATAYMREHFRHKWYLSRQFNAQIEHLQGVYVPYHLYDLHASGWGDYIGVHQTSSGNGSKADTGFIALHRAGYADISMLPVDGSSKMPDAHMDAIAPFDFSQMRDFSTSYVAGFLTEVPDEDASACFPRAESRARIPFVNQLAENAGATHKVNRVETIASHANVELVNATTCCLPVWLMHCTWNDYQMLFAVNGQTGKCVGDLPIDRARRTVTAVVTTLIALAIAVPMFLGLVKSDAPSELYLVPLLVLGIPFMLDAFFKEQMKTAVESTDDGMSYSSSGLVITESWNGPKFHLGRNNALADFKTIFVREGLTGQQNGFTGAMPSNG